MEFKLEKRDQQTVLHLAGQLLECDRAPFESLIPKLVASDTKLIEIDLSQLTYMDSIGLGLLVTLHGRAKQIGASVVLKLPQGDVRELLESAAIDRLMTIRQE